MQNRFKTHLNLKTVKGFVLFHKFLCSPQGYTKSEQQGSWLHGIFQFQVVAMATVNIATNQSISFYFFEKLSCLKLKVFWLFEREVAMTNCIAQQGILEFLNLDTKVSIFYICQQ